MWIMTDRLYVVVSGPHEGAFVVGDFSSSRLVYDSKPYAVYEANGQTVETDRGEAAVLAPVPFEVVPREDASGVVVKINSCRQPSH
jgi:hypothetical protein